MKVLHVHTDKKFISDSKRFEVLDIENTILYIYDKKVHRDFPENCLLVNKNRYCLKKIVEVGEGFDSVVLYDLDPIKIAIANALPQRITIIWRFFGHELYKINKSDYLSETTISSNLVYERNLLRKIKVSSNYRVNKYINEVIFRYDHDFHKAISKISYILGVFEEEYNFLKEKFSLPKFIQIPLRELSLQSNNEKKCKIIIGNSKNDFNNHLDILELLEGRDNSDCVMPISYGADSVYSKNIKYDVQKDFFSL